jgi:hypothetical protein
MTPVPFVRSDGRPRYPLAVIDPKGNLKGQIMTVLEAHGVTCDEILAVMDEVKAEPAKLSEYFRLSP